MSRGVQSFRQSDVRRALRATKAAGLDVARVELKDGKIVIVTGKPPAEAEIAEQGNPWDSAA